MCRYGPRESWFDKTWRPGEIEPVTTRAAAPIGARVENRTPDLAAVPTMTFEERRSLALSSAVAERLRRNPERVIAKARENLKEMRLIGQHEQPWVDVWESLLKLGPGPVCSLLTSVDQFARDLRQSSPIAGVLTGDERRRAVHGLQR